MKIRYINSTGEVTLLPMIALRPKKRILILHFIFWGIAFEFNKTYKNTNE